jgi:hypothetical protein
MPIDALQPDEVMAMQFDTIATAADLAAWCGGEVLALAEVLDAEPTTFILVPTVEGSQRAQLGDWIVRNSSGAFSVMSTRQFAARHDPSP